MITASPTFSYAVCFLYTFCCWANAAGNEIHCELHGEIAGGSYTLCYDPSQLKLEQDVLIHFHGAKDVASKNFEQSKIDAVLIVVNFNGLSSAYRVPFEQDEKLFARLLDECLRELRAASQLAELRWRTVCLSSFSAGYGAVREILKSDEYFERIEGVLAADSIYASLEEGSAERTVSRLQMRDFLRLAEAAAREEKTFIVSHSYLETPYASTKETADYLLAQLKLKRKPITESDDLEVAGLNSHAASGQFQVLGVRGVDGPAHLEHLRNIHVFWQYLPLKKRTHEP